MSRDARVLSEGVYFGEGPRWRQGRLWFSDFFARAVKSVSLAGDVRVEVELDDAPSGLGWTPDGAMLVVSMAKRRVMRRAPDGAMTVHADLSRVATFLCNDMVVDASGGAYVGDFGFDFHDEVLKRGEAAVFADHPATRLARVAPDGAVTVAADDMHFPNGSVITPDGKTLIVGETLGARLTAFDIGPDGALTGRRVWAPTFPRVPDGICLDAAGAVWIANPIGPECARIARGRGGPGDRRDQPAMLCLHARRRRRQNAVPDDRALVDRRARSRCAQGPDRDRRRRYAARRLAMSRRYP